MSKIKIALGLYGLVLLAAMQGPTAAQEVKTITVTPRETEEAQQICNHYVGWGAECQIRINVSPPADQPTIADQAGAGHPRESRDAEMASPKR